MTTEANDINSAQQGLQERIAYEEKNAVVRVVKRLSDGEFRLRKTLYIVENTGHETKVFLSYADSDEVSDISVRVGWDQWNGSDELPVYMIATKTIYTDDDNEPLRLRYPAPLNEDEHSFSFDNVLDALRQTRRARIAYRFFRYIGLED